MLRPISVTSFRLEFRCANIDVQDGETLLDLSEMDNLRDVRCGTAWYGVKFCHTQNVISQQNLYERVREIMAAIPTLRKVILLWARCYATLPNWVVGIDLDNVPHSVDRPGDWSDKWDKNDKDW